MESKKIQKNKFNNNINIGWNKLDFTKNELKQIFKKFNKSHFYFIHSYYSNPKIALKKLQAQRMRTLNFVQL